MDFCRVSFNLKIDQNYNINVILPNPQSFSPPKWR